MPDKTKLQDCIKRTTQFHRQIGLTKRESYEMKARVLEADAYFEKYYPKSKSINCDNANERKKFADKKKSGCS